MGEDSEGCADSDGTDRSVGGMPEEPTCKTGMRGTRSDSEGTDRSVCATETGRLEAGATRESHARTGEDACAVRGRLRNGAGLGKMRVAGISFAR